MIKQNRKKICILGSGGHAASCIDLIESTKKFEIVGVITKKKENKLNKKFLNKYKIIGTDNDLLKIVKYCKNIVIGIALYKKLDLRIKIFKNLKKIGFNIPSICSPRSYMANDVYIGEGSQIFHGVTINKNSRIEKNCIINSHSLIEHDANIKENCQISTGVIINGGCVIGKNSFIGSGSILRENLIIKGKTFIKIGSIIKK